MEEYDRDNYQQDDEDYIEGEYSETEEDESEEYEAEPEITENQDMRQVAPDYQQYNNTQYTQNNQYNPYTNADVNSAPNYAYQQYYNQQQYQKDPFVRVDIKPEKPKKKENVFKKFLFVVAAAVIFGIVAGGAFFGTTRLIEYVTPGSTNTGNTTATTQMPDSGDTTVPTIAASTTVSSTHLESTSVTDIAENAIKFTVAVNCTFTSSSWFGQYTSEGSGTGIIVGKNDTELLIVTNNHVVDGAKTTSVCFVNGTEIKAVQKGTDSKADLAVIAVKLADIDEETLSAITYATLGDSDSVKVGEMVVAVGNALGYGQSVTVGYISAKNRDVTVDGVTMTLLQTDAAINPGNSGGALINMNGEVIGINSVKYSDESVEGMGFSIPVSNVTEIIENLMNSLSADEKGYIGVYVQDVTEEISKYYNWPVGVYVVSFTDNSGAAEAGIQKGDIITAINGVSVTNSTDMIEIVTSNRYGTVISVTVQRNENSQFVEYTYQVTLSQSSEYVETDTTPTPTTTPSKHQR